MHNKKKQPAIARLEKNLKQFQIKKNIIQDSYNVAEKLWKMNMKSLALDLLRKLEEISRKENTLAEVFFKSYREELQHFYEGEFKDSKLLKINHSLSETPLFTYFQEILYNKISSGETFEEVLKKSPYNRFSTFRVLYNFKLEGFLELSLE